MSKIWLIKKFIDIFHIFAPKVDGDENQNILSLVILMLNPLKLTFLNNFYIVEQNRTNFIFEKKSGWNVESNRYRYPKLFFLNLHPAMRNESRIYIWKQKISLKNPVPFVLRIFILLLSSDLCDSTETQFPVPDRGDKVD